MATVEQPFPGNPTVQRRSSRYEGSLGRNGRPSRTEIPRPDWLPETVWPFHTFGLKTDDSTIAVTDVGKGPALLFVHTGFWSFLWRDVIARLSDEFRCVCLDAPGTGLSTSVAPRAITLQHSARSVAAVIEALELRDLTLVIHDLGGPAGLAAAARTPERVSAIAALNTFGWRPSGALFRGMLTLMGSGLIREFDALTQFLPRVTASAFGVARRMDPVSRAAFRGGIGRSGLRSFHYYRHDALHCDPLYEEIGRALVGPFRHLPLLTIFGEQNDPLGFQPVWNGLFPQAIQVVVPKGNHFPMCDDPELVAHTICNWHRERVRA